MRAAQPPLTIPQSAPAAGFEPERPAGSGRAESLVARVVAAGVLCAAVAAIVWYVLESVLAL
jgi:hypothetical protein